MRRDTMLDGICDILYERITGPGLFMTSVGRDGTPNVMLIGWGQFGSSYVGNPSFVAAVTPRRYTWHLLEQVPEFVVAVPTDALAKAVRISGSRSGRDIDKFQAGNITPVPSKLVSAPSIEECPINLECRVYSRVDPPHTLLWPGVQNDDHTIYFAEVVHVSADRTTREPDGTPL